MLLQVVSRIRRHFHRSQSRHQDPPDLRRWSDFMNPFPSVSPGGYRRYYEKHGIPVPKPPPVVAPPLIKDLPLPSAPAPTLVSPLPFPTSPKSGHKRARTRTLSTIPESPGNSIIGVRMHNLSNTSSLRRRRRRLLRTPSVERDFPAKAPIFPTTESDYTSSNESSQSYSTRSYSTHSDSIDSPPTTVEDIDESDPSLFKEEACLAPDPHDRPDSRSSYHTANSDFSEV